MDHPLNSVIDLAIRKAEADGMFRDLPGAGKPLPPVRSPSDAVLNRLITESRAKPPAVVLKEKIAASQARLRHLSDAEERKAEMKVLADLQTRLSLELEAFRKYG